jgi:hypothetical protein
MGLKPRPGAPVELSMHGGGADYSGRATVNLRTGRTQVRESRRARFRAPWKTRELEIAVPARDLPRLRAIARDILAVGDKVYREQFAQQGVSFSARSRTRQATADFHIDVGAGTRYDAAWDAVFRRVPTAG